MAHSFEIVPVPRADFRTAARFADRHDLGLRGGDALHLAICEDHGISLCTLDQKMYQAAMALGVRAVPPLKAVD
jgi:predicted nucleic acid-binding protein